MAKKFNEVVDSLRKNITREYKAKLTKDQRKAFRSQMWAFRRDPESLSAEEKPALEALFEKIPALRPLYKVRRRRSHPKSKCSVYNLRQETPEISQKSPSNEYHTEHFT